MLQAKIQTLLQDIEQPYPEEYEALKTMMLDKIIGN